MSKVFITEYDSNKTYCYTETPEQFIKNFGRDTRRQKGIYVSQSQLDKECNLNAWFSKEDPCVFVVIYNGKVVTPIHKEDAESQLICGDFIFQGETT